LKINLATCSEEELWHYVAVHLKKKGIDTVLVGGAVVSISRSYGCKELPVYCRTSITSKYLNSRDRNKFVLEPQSQSFLKTLDVSKSSVGKIVTKLMNLGSIEHETEKGYRISEPILGHYLLTLYF
jgi:hypothetical protein